MRYRMETMRSLGPLAKAIDLLFQIIDERTRDAYRAAFDLLSPGAVIYSTKNANEGLFPLHAIVINPLTEDSGDWKGGSGIFGKFTEAKRMRARINPKESIPIIREGPNEDSAHRTAAEHASGGPENDWLQSCRAGGLAYCAGTPYLSIP